MDWNLMWYVLAVVLALVGVAGLIVPVLPGVPLLFAGMLLAAWADGFEHLSWPTLTVLGVLTLLSVAIDVLASVFGARRVGASRLALVGALIGGLAGVLFMPIGLFAGPFAGALAGELVSSRHVGKATKVGVGTSLGILVGMALKLALAAAMFGVFALAWWV